MKLPRRDNFCIWPRALRRCRRCRASLGRKLIRRGRSGSLFLFRRAGPLTRSVARGPTR